MTGLGPLFREIHAVHEVLKAWVRAQIVHSEVSLQEVGKVGGSFLVRSFEVFESLVCVSQSSVDRCNHVRRNVTAFRLALPFVEYLLRLLSSARGRVRVCQSSSRI
jgi:hypothetical protein